MKKYYEILGLHEGASEQQIKEAYERLSRELSINYKNDNLTNIQKEYDKVQEAYNALIMEISNTEKIINNNLKNESNKNLSINIAEKKSFMRNYTFKEIVFCVLLLFIATGIWGVFLQNLGYFKNEKIIVDENKVQQVRVVNTVDTNIQSGEVNVSGNVSIDNTVSVSVDEVLGEDNKKYYFKNN